MRHVDCLIVGQGLAGSTLAWALRERGVSVFVIDREEQVTSSKVAAGLMTSVTGQRLVPSWRWNELWPAAVDFYRGFEAQAGVTILHAGPMVRLLGSDIEQASLDRRRVGTDARLFAPLASPLRADWFTRTEPAVELPEGGRLNVPLYLERVRECLERDGAYATLRLALPGDLVVTADGVAVPSQRLSATRVVFCDGIAARTNPWLAGLRFNPARGEILTLRVPGLDEDRVIHGGIWLARQAGDQYRVGATYDWKDLNAGPTTAGREELEAKLRSLLRLPFEIIGHDAAVRPILHHLPPVAGFLPDNPRIGCFNGLGSKGSLQAPLFARQLAEHILQGASLDAEVDPARRKDFAG
jgi:glycine oxidase